MLTGPEILRQVELGNIFIDPFDRSLINPNSVNLRLGPELLVYVKAYRQHQLLAERETHYAMLRPGYNAMDDQSCARVGIHATNAKLAALHDTPLVMTEAEEVVSLTIPKTGLVLFPGILYLGHTIEAAGSNVYAPCIEGRSSIGRLGIAVHVSAGFGDVGFSAADCPAQWTLELTVVHPVRVLAGGEIAQIMFHPVTGQVRRYVGKYTGQTGPRASAIWKDFLPK